MNYIYIYLYVYLFESAGKVYSTDAMIRKVTSYIYIYSKIYATDIHCFLLNWKSML